MRNRATICHRKANLNMADNRFIFVENESNEVLLDINAAYAVGPAVLRRGRKPGTTVPYQ